MQLDTVVLGDPDTVQRMPNEPVRHKILDLLGDLQLLGADLYAHVIATRSGHRTNAELVRRLLDLMQAQETGGLIQRESGMDIREILRQLPHRYPFLLIDRVVDLPGDRKCTAIKNVSINEPFFEGHFPGHPVMPGVLQLEAMAQAASILVMRLPDNQGKIGYFMSADNVKFRRPVVPGDTLFINTEIMKMRRNIGLAHCECSVNGEVVSSGELKFAVMDA